ncbi:MAG: apolipoprotein N-acyltransferase [Verrucomicrobia bacterium]|nr:apolipoprotein N-acyltransferase [Verrucomicrobiota bacterium]
MKRIIPIAAAVLSGVLLFLSFPPFEIEFLGWVALIPLILACAGAAPRRAAGLGWLAGAIFFLGTLFWLRHVTWFGFVALAFYCALYMIPFATFISLRSCGWRSMARVKNLAWIIGAAAVWTASEYVRATFITGFPWNPLGVSQYAQGTLIQIAEWGGVYFLSALMVFVNVASAVTLLQYISGLRSSGYRLHVELMSALFLLALASSFGLRVLLAEEASSEPVRAALIQPNVPEVGNWDVPDPELIYERLEELTDIAGHMLDLDLIIWPETALPDCVRYSARSAGLVEQTTRITGVPLLAGSMDYIWRPSGTPDFYNGSMLFNTRGELLSSYYKQHLVLFGEYIPFDGQIPFVNALTPIGSSFTPGHQTTLFKLPGDPRGFSVLICFEDTLPYLARRAAQRGATWLVNQTNDSWFDPDCGSKQHLANAVFRCIETRLPMVRCTNTGITCLIDKKGRITQTIAPRVEGVQAVEVTPADPARAPTIHTRFGDWFAQACLLGSVALFIVALIKRRKTTHA